MKLSLKTGAIAAGLISLALVGCTNAEPEAETMEPEIDAT